ncbi:MAG: Glucokinase [Labilithrix sp.]|nr:Glucokinase [Labilithrix sp.]
MSLILAGDIGGTHARFALLEPTGRRVVHEEVLDSKTFDTFEAAVQRFLDGAAKSPKLQRGDAILAASFGIAGPIVGGRVRTTNLPWTIEEKKVGRTIGVSKVTLLNDLVASGLGALAAPSRKIEVVYLGRPAKRGGNIAVIAAGTGLGEAAFIWDGTVHVPCATEGAHVELAARNEVEIALWRVLEKRFGHVSYERVASGSTISVLYEFFVHDRNVRESKANRARVESAPDANVAVVELATSGASEAAMRAIELWSSVYGAETGNLALKTFATGGVYICGGASARLSRVLAHGLPGRVKKGHRSPFITSFLDKGRMRPLLEKIPIALCIEPLAGLRGAAAHAALAAANAPRGTRTKRAAAALKR